MAYNTPETVADYLARFQMEITHRGKGTFTPDHVKYSLTIASGGKDFFTTFESNPHVHGEPTITQVFDALLTWLPEHTEWLEEAEFDGLLEGCKGDIYKMVQMAQYVCFKSDLYDHCEDICRYGTLDQLRDMGVYAIRESLADKILNDLSYDEDYAPTDDAKDTIISAIYATFEEKYGEDFADCADNFIQDNDDIAGRVNPCAMSVETVRAVYGMGFDAVFLNDWKKELAECDIDPEAVSVDSEAHDMENGRDGLDGNAPEKDAPEKDDRDAQPPVDTDNR